MAATWEELAEEAMALPSDSRAKLAHRLLESLGGEKLGPIDELWITEAKPDLVASTGQAETIDGETALCSVRESLSRQFTLQFNLASTLIFYFRRHTPNKRLYAADAGVVFAAIKER